MASHLVEADRPRGPRAALLRLLAGALATVASRGERRWTILIFHRVTAEPDPLFPGEMHATRFDAIMSALASSFNVLALPAAMALVRNDALPSRAISITFDDGYADNHTVALPILRRHGLPATFFVASGFLDGGIMWNDEVIEAIRRCERSSLDLSWLDLGDVPLATVDERRLAIERLLPALKYRSLGARADAIARLRGATGTAAPKDVMMTSAQVLALRDAGMEIGGHTRRHPILAVLPDGEARREIADDRAALASILGEAPRYFAYPNGKPGEDYLPKHVEMVREAGYEAACSTAWGSTGKAFDRFQLPRFTPWDRDPGRFALRLAHNFGRRAAGIDASASVGRM